MAGGFCVISTTAIADGTRGALTRWMLEPAPGVYVGTLTRRVREHLWAGLREAIDAQEGWAVMVHGADTEQGYRVLTYGEGSRTPRTIDGLTLIGWPKETLEEVKNL
ncbi:type I-E CRISPR-associated endoribonuclease Cas2e [Allosalinactinospora lopnorensis]|uniref:type I-E CRISPR-associated endoribonuclease Cas2e n=1 Tax=Allosalinactinospora lopnorensis TaxID=1352348 RepID=UPI000623F899|nr:type I-E CRISPR-associated endoribonuclease Cas2e [Allosalinactinospora lopnorensis]